MNINKKKQSRKKSKTPRGKSRKGKLSFIGSQKKYNKSRPNTGKGFYPDNSQQEVDILISPSRTQNNNQLNYNIKTYNTLTQEKEEGKDLPSQRSLYGNRDSRTKFKINPSPYKRGEQSIGQLIDKIDDQIQEIQRLDSKEMKKIIHGSKSKKKGARKHKRKKARSHSPQEAAVKLQKMVSIQGNAKNQIIKNIHKGSILTNKEKTKKLQKSGMTSRNKKNINPNGEMEDRPLKIKTITNMKSKVCKKNKAKAQNNQKKSSKKQSLHALVQELKRKKDNLISTWEEIYVRAAIVIQRWYRNVKNLKGPNSSPLGENQIQPRSNLPGGAGSLPMES